MCCALKTTLVNVVLWVLALIGLSPVTPGWVASVEEWIGYTDVTDPAIVIYKTAADLELSAAVFNPTTQLKIEKHPTVVLFRDNDLTRSDDTLAFELCKTFASLGYVSLCFEHRPASDCPLLEEPVQDVHDAFHWIEEHATDLAVDLARIAVLGQSREAFVTTRAILLQKIPENTAVAASALLLHNPQLPFSSDEGTLPFIAPSVQDLPEILVVTDDVPSNVVGDAERFVSEMCRIAGACDPPIFKRESSSQGQQAGTELAAIMYNYLSSIGF